MNLITKVRLIPMNKLKFSGKKNNLRIVEYTSHLMPPVQYISMSVCSLSIPAKGSEEATWISKTRWRKVG